jgi:hypothetical protein
MVTGLLLIMQIGGLISSVSALALFESSFLQGLLAYWGGALIALFATIFGQMVRAKAEDVREESEDSTSRSEPGLLMEIGENDWRARASFVE